MPDSSTPLDGGQADDPEAVIEELLRDGTAFLGALEGYWTRPTDEKTRRLHETKDAFGATMARVRVQRAPRPGTRRNSGS